MTRTWDYGLDIISTPECTGSALGIQHVYERRKETFKRHALIKVCSTAKCLVNLKFYILFTRHLYYVN